MYVPIHEIVSERSATFAINVPDLRASYWLLKYATQMGQPLILQVSERVLRNEGEPFIGSLISQIRQFPVRATAHIDHCSDVELCRKALDWGVSSVLFDGSKLPFEKNLETARGLVQYAKTLGGSVEGEVSPIPGAEDGKAHAAGTQVSVADAIRFVRETGVFCFAPYFGNAHGHYPATFEGFDYDYLESLKQQCPVPLVIHGGSGIQKADATRILGIGAGKINFSTDFKEALSGNTDNREPYLAGLDVEKKVQLAFQRLREIWLT